MFLVSVLQIFSSVVINNIFVVFVQKSIGLSLLDSDIVAPKSLSIIDLKDEFDF